MMAAVDIVDTVGIVLVVPTVLASRTAWWWLWLAVGDHARHLLQ